MTIHQSDPGDEHQTPVRAAIVFSEAFKRRRASVETKPEDKPENPQVEKQAGEIGAD